MPGVDDAQLSAMLLHCPRPQEHLAKELEQAFKQVSGAHARLSHPPPSPDPASATRSLPSASLPAMVASYSARAPPVSPPSSAPPPPLGIYLHLRHARVALASKSYDLLLLEPNARAGV